MGELVIEENVLRRQKVILNVASLPVGCYILSVFDENQKIEKLIEVIR